jgi:hypothetical protein
LEAKADSHHEEQMAIMKASRKVEAKMNAWIELTEACVRKLEANREKLEAAAEHQEIPK